MLFPRSQSDSPPAPAENPSQTPASPHDTSLRTSQRGCNQNTSRTRTKPLPQPAPHARSLCCWPPCLSSCLGPALLAPAAPLFLSCATHNSSSSAIGSLWGTSASGHFSPPLLPCCLGQQPLTWSPTPALCAGLSLHGLGVSLSGQCRPLLCSEPPQLPSHLRVQATSLQQSCSPCLSHTGLLAALCTYPMINRPGALDSLGPPV